MTDYATRLLARRKVHGLTQAQVAERSGCSRVAIGHIEHGRQNASDILRARLAWLGEEPVNPPLVDDSEPLTFPRPRVCFQCGSPFTARQIRHIYCSYACRIAWAEQNKEPL